MNVLIVGSGGREYSIGCSLKKEKNLKNLYFYPGNGATIKIGENIKCDSLKECIKFAKSKDVNLAIIGPEVPLSKGAVDLCLKNNILAFGPSKKASRLESSKAFAKKFLMKNSIPTAKYIESSNIKEIQTFIKTLKKPVVIKADTLRAGKGVVIASSDTHAIKISKDMLSGDFFGDVERKLVVEEFIDGYEISVFVLIDGDSFKILPFIKDYKKLLDGDRGPNTGGMGAYGPLRVKKSVYKSIKNSIVLPSIKKINGSKDYYRGVLFIGIIVSNDKPYVLEYNVRFGDPECQIIMSLLKSSVLDLFYKTALSKLSDLEIEFFDKKAVGVVAVTKDYPYSTSSPTKIKIKKGGSSNYFIYFAGVSAYKGQLFTAGGRVLICVGLGNSFKSAKERAYKAMKKIIFRGKRNREDILSSSSYSNSD